MASSRAAIGLLVAASSLAVALSDGGSSGPEYGYAAGSADGPENWGKLSPAYKMCGQGKHQSPIDIVTKQAVPNPNLDSLTRTYAAANATLVNDGHDITLKFDGKVGTITVSGKVYSFEKLHWHSPSDHTINGQRFPLELHLVHKSADGAVAVIGILYQLGAPDSFYYQLKSKLGEMAGDKCNFAEEESHVEAGLIHLRSLQKRTGSYFRYTGSLTAPPCTENVVWNVLGKVRQISKEQLRLLEAPLPGSDARPTQPLNDRTVQFYNPPNSTISFQM
ncbi:Alpha carbonic anhydrase 7 [Dichanthelium oligosanthes]|uniref:Alpha carbonic anhydrase 7 n=1 Tax=Dichanthelium oligosanthes TaxID=888268 RepID=A0A1E5W323_9POAL|nr:Alpha carbonic anhydrase 7 [Dichanthelium oligosanthes]